MKNNVVFVLNSQSILLALHTLETARGRTKTVEAPPLPIGELYNQVTKDSDGNWVELNSFNVGIENLENAGLVTLCTPIVASHTEGKTRTGAEPIVQTALRTVCLTPAGRDLAEQHPEWSSVEIDHATTTNNAAATMTAGVGRR